MGQNNKNDRFAVNASSSAFIGNSLFNNLKKCDYNDPCEELDELKDHIKELNNNIKQLNSRLMQTEYDRLTSLWDYEHGRNK